MPGELSHSSHAHYSSSTSKVTGVKGKALWERLEKKAQEKEAQEKEAELFLYLQFHLLKTYIFTISQAKNKRNVTRINKKGVEEGVKQKEG